MRCLLIQLVCIMLFKVLFVLIAIASHGGVAFQGFMPRSRVTSLKMSTSTVAATETILVSSTLFGTQFEYIGI